MTDSDPRDITERLTEAASEFQNDLQSDLEHGHMNSVARTWAERRAMPLLREAASTIAHLRGEVERNATEATEAEAKAARECDRADRAEAREKALREALTVFVDEIDHCGEHQEFLRTFLPGRHVGYKYAAIPLDDPIMTKVTWHDPHCCASRGCHLVCSHLCGTDLASNCCTPPASEPPKCKTCKDGVLPAETFGLRHDEPCPDCLGSGRAPASEGRDK